jgi:hypothetical protein
MENKIPVVYLIGSGHCGSTLLDMIMGAHSKIVGVGELHRFSTQKDELKRMVCTCKKSPLACPFWSKIILTVDCSSGLGVYQSKANFLLGRKKYIFKNKNKDSVSIKDYLELNEKIYESILNYSGREIVFDSSKEINRAELLLLSKKLNIILLHLVRDGKGVMWSYKRKYRETFSSIWRWLALNLKSEIIKKRNKDRKIIFLRYEDLARNPQKTLERILGEIGLKFEPQMLNFREAEQHQINGNRLRFSQEKEIKEDLSWKENLSSFDLFLFHVLAGWLNKIYGY